MRRESRLPGPSMPWALRLLLLAALVLGIATMHTLGHPSAAHGGHDRPTAFAAHMAGGAAAALPAPPAPPAAQAAESGGGMDPMAVCLAVLAGWSLVLLATACLRLRRSGDAAAAVRARMLRAVRALPPPAGGRTLLNRLSVLRQ